MQPPSHVTPLRLLLATPPVAISTYYRHQRPPLANGCHPRPFRMLSSTTTVSGAHATILSGPHACFSRVGMIKGLQICFRLSIGWVLILHNLKLKIYKGQLGL